LAIVDSSKGGGKGGLRFTIKYRNHWTNGGQISKKRKRKN